VFVVACPQTRWFIAAAVSAEPAGRRQLSALASAAAVAADALGQPLPALQLLHLADGAAASAGGGGAAEADVPAALARAATASWRHRLAAAAVLEVPAGPHLHVGSAALRIIKARLRNLASHLVSSHLSPDVRFSYATGPGRVPVGLQDSGAAAAAACRLRVAPRRRAACGGAPGRRAGHRRRQVRISKS